MASRAALNAGRSRFVPSKASPKSRELEARILDILRHRVGKDERAAKTHDWFTAAVLALRDEVIDLWMASTRRTYDAGGKRVYYLSLEFLIGRLLRDAISNLGLGREMEQALRSHGLELSALEELEPNAVLGNGGLTDTVIDANLAALGAGVATGVQFSGVTYYSLAAAVSRTVALYGNRPVWRTLQRNGMKADFSWNNSGRAYAELSRELVQGQ